MTWNSIHVLPSENLSRVHDPSWIERLLDCPHAINCHWTKFGDQVVLLAITDVMLARAGSFLCERALRQSANERLDTPDLAGVVSHKRDDGMEIPIADMPEQRRGQTCLSNVLLSLRDAFNDARAATIKDEEC